MKLDVEGLDASDIRFPGALADGLRAAHQRREAEHVSSKVTFAAGAM